jgi:hypothetical protein
MLPAIMAGAQAVYGLYRGFKAKSALDELSGQRRPEFMDAANPLMQNKALQEQQYRQGLTPATRALYQQQQASNLASQQRATSEMSGGQMSNALSRMSNLNVNNGALSLAAQNESAQRQGMQGMIGTNRELSGLQQRDIGQKIDYRNQMERGYGQAQQQAFQDVLGAGVGFAQMQMAQSEADKNRQFYKDLYGIKEPTTTSTTPSTTPSTSPTNESSMMQGTINVPKIGGRSYLYKDLAGNQRMGFSNPNLNNLPLSMGGTNVGLEGRFNQTNPIPTNPSDLPPNMGGTNLGMDFQYNPIPTSQSNLPPSMGGTNLGMNNIQSNPFPANPSNLPPSMGGTNLGMDFQYNPFPANPANLPPSMGGYNLGYGNNRYGIRSFTRPK